MSEGFLKLLRTDKANFLLTKYPIAFALLTFIAIHARRYNGHPDGLLIGDALVSSKSLKITRGQFREALKKLADLKIVKILSNGKNLTKTQKSAISTTIIGHLVNICDPDIYDINPEWNNQHSNQRTTNEQPTNNHKQEEEEDISNDISKEEIALRDGAHSATPIRSKDLLTFNFENYQFDGITERDLADWALIYPHVNSKIETLKAAQWVKSNPTRGNKKQWRKFLTGWLQRANDNIENKKAYKTVGTPGVDRRTKNPNGTPVEAPHLEGLF